MSSDPGSGDVGGSDDPGVPDDGVGDPEDASRRDHDDAVRPDVEWAGRPAPDQRRDDRRELPSSTDPAVREASTVVGGPIGAHAVVGRSRHVTPLRVIFLLALLFLALGWFTKAGCLQQHRVDGGGLQLDWSNNRQFIGLCYNDTVPLYGTELLSKGELPYKASWTQPLAGGGQQVRYMEYPVVTGMYMYGSMVVAKGWAFAHDHWGVPGALDVVLFFNVVALGLALFWLVTIWATTRLAGVRVWSVAVAAVSPLVAVHIFTNFDAIATAMLALGMVAWARRHPAWAGLFIGLGLSAKLYPVLLLIPLFVLCLRAGRLRDFLVTAAATVGTAVVVNLPILLLYPAGWREFFRLNSTRHPDATSLFRVIGEATGYDWGVVTGQAPTLVNTVSLAAFAVVCAGVVVIGLRAPTRPRLAQLLFLTLAGFLLVNKVWSPQYSLWLVPIAVLAIPHTRVLWGWMALDALVWVPLVGIFMGPETRWLPDGWAYTALAVRDLVVLGLCVLVITQIYRPATDLVRNPSSGDDVDDPIGGVLDHAPDVIGGRRRDHRDPERQSVLAG
ncbi:glycosyltransferase family 87 protein [Williamsia sterculiae]|uniref:Uncharacterized membrane protein n=1 Tax=Williamsia sterculiae TaxID=1344003 RepID=A0A1N7FIH5_9NOCA|nr:glycosyltransferase 87 family protein [Williamsia sterculiae]SIS00045.1 Uncharacterized membrane protein [Williamsia sterculiae]